MVDNKHWLPSHSFSETKQNMLQPSGLWCRLHNNSFGSSRKCHVMGKKDCVAGQNMSAYEAIKNHVFLLLTLSQVRDRKNDYLQRCISVTV